MQPDTGLLSTNLSYKSGNISGNGGYGSHTLSRPLKFAVLHGLYTNTSSSNVSGYQHYYVIIPSGGKVYAFQSPTSYYGAQYGSTPIVNVLEFDPSTTSSVNINTYNNGSYASMSVGGSSLSWDSAMTTITVNGLYNQSYNFIDTSTYLLVY